MGVRAMRSCLVACCEMPLPTNASSMSLLERSVWRLVARASYTRHSASAACLCKSFPGVPASCRWCSSVRTGCWVLPCRPCAPCAAQALVDRILTLNLNGLLIFPIPLFVLAVDLAVRSGAGCVSWAACGLGLGLDLLCVADAM